MAINRAARRNVRAAFVPDLLGGLLMISQRAVLQGMFRRGPPARAAGPAARRSQNHRRAHDAVRSCAGAESGSAPASRRQPARQLRLRPDMSTCRTTRRSHGLFFVLGALLAAGCAPEVLAMNVGNPARGGNAAGAMQSYEVPPYRQDHRYEATLQTWSPSSLAFRIHLVNADRCGLPSSYSF